MSAKEDSAETLSDSKAASCLVSGSQNLVLSSKSILKFAKMLMRLISIGKCLHSKKGTWRPKSLSAWVLLVGIIHFLFWDRFHFYHFFALTWTFLFILKRSGPILQVFLKLNTFNIIWLVSDCYLLCYYTVQYTAIFMQVHIVYVEHIALSLPPATSPFVLCPSHSFP